MKVYIENILHSLTKQDNIKSRDFDIISGQFVSITLTESITKTDIYHYGDYDLLFCIAQKEQQEYIRFVLYNLSRQYSIVLCQIKMADEIRVYRLSEKNFVLLVTEYNQTAMHCLYIKNDSVGSHIVQLNTVHQLSFAHAKYVIVNSSMHLLNNYQHSIIVYKSSGEVLRIVYSIKSAHSLQIRFLYQENKLAVFDVHSTDILTSEELK